MMAVSIVMQVNLCVNHTLGLVNTQLFAAYAAIDPRLAKLTAIVKHWAKRRQVVRHTHAFSMPLDPYALGSVAFC